MIEDDVKATSKFRSEIVQEENLWKYFEIRTCLLKYSDDDETWKVGFLFIRLLDHKIPIQSFLPDLKRLKMLHEVLPIKDLKDLLDLVSTKQKVRLGGVEASLELVTRPYTELFGVEDPCYGLNATGNYSSKLDDTYESVRSELPLLSIPFQDLKDVCNALFRLDFGTRAYSHFVVALAPFAASIGNVDFDRKKIAVSLRISPEIDLNKISLNLYGNNKTGEPTSLRKSIIQFDRAKDSDMVIAPIIAPDSDSVYVKLELYFKKELVETKSVGVETRMPVSASMTFSYEIEGAKKEKDIKLTKERIKKLFEEVRNESNQAKRGYKFEQVIRAVFLLVPRLKITSNNINDRIEEIDIQVRNHNRKHVWADFDDVVFIECKYLKQKATAADVRNFLGKLRKNRRKTGIFVSVTGFTGRDEMEGARGEVKTSFVRDGTHVVILDEADLDDIFRCRDVSELIDDRYTDIFKWKFKPDSEVKDPLHIIKLRYANGEIDHDQYQKMYTALNL
ncbi:MAG: hypothetical protein GEU26_06425 [Nitrososphaeraceae archaeon]|nr:hypothetical protein [Nitrososphaeraceae archaeon]